MLSTTFISLEMEVDFFEELTEHINSPPLPLSFFHKAPDSTWPALVHGVMEIPQSSHSNKHSDHRLA